MGRHKKLEISTGDFKCRSCKLTWSTFLQNNDLCNNSILGNGRHNFDFKKPISGQHNMMEEKIKLRIPASKKN